MILTNPSVALLETILSTLSGINWLLNEIRYIKHWLGNNANILFEVTPIPLCYIRCLQNHKQREHYTCWFWKKIEDIYAIQFSICHPVGKNIISKHFLMFLPTEHEFITILEYGVRANGYSQSRSHFKCKRSIVEIRRSIAFGKIVLLHTHRILERWPEYWWEDKVFSKLQAFLEGRKCKNINIFTPKVLCACPSANSYARWKCEIYIVKPKQDPERVVSGDKIAYKTLTERNIFAIFLKRKHCVLTSIIDEQRYLHGILRIPAMHLKAVSDQNRKNLTNLMIAEKLDWKHCVSLENIYTLHILWQWYISDLSIFVS